MAERSAAAQFGQHAAKLFQFFESLDRGQVQAAIESGDPAKFQAAFGEKLQEFEALLKEGGKIAEFGLTEFMENLQEMKVAFNEEIRKA